MIPCRPASFIAVRFGRSPRKERRWRLAQQPRHSLEQALYTLRRALGADALIAGGTSVSLNHEVVTSDVVEFTAACEADAMQRAVELYAGPFLDGFHLSGSAEFERWVDGERAELHGRYIAALESVARDAAAAGDHAAAVQAWRRAAAAEPLSARVALGLLRALDAAGDRTGALQAAAVHETLVREELESRPDPSIVAFVEELKRAPERVAAARGRPVAVRPASRQAESLASPAHEASSATKSATGRRRWWPVRDRRIWFVAATAVALVTLAVALISRDDGAGQAVASTTPPMIISDRARVLVTAFENATGDAALEPVGRVAADWISEGLILTGLVQVLDREIGPPADAVVSGTVYTRGDSVWLQARITRQADGEILAMVSEPALRGNPSQSIERLRQRVLGTLAIHYDPRLKAYAAAVLRPPLYEAAVAVAAGIDHFAFPRDLEAAAERFREAADLDSGYIQPRLWLTWTSIMAYEYARADSMAAALDSLRDEMSPLDRIWHERITTLLDGDNEGTYQAALRSVQIAPRSGLVVALASSALETNRPAVTISTLRNAGMQNLGPERAFPWFLLTAAHHALGDYEAELAATDSAIADIGLAWGFLGPGVPALAALGRFDDIETRLDELRSVKLENGMLGGLVGLQTAIIELRAHGFDDRAKALLERMRQEEWTFPADGPDAAYASSARVGVLYELSRWDEAEQALENAPRDRRDEMANGASYRLRTHEIERRAMAGLIAARRDDKAEARRVDQVLAAIDEPYLLGEPTFWRARIAAVLGEHDRAVDLLRQAFDEGRCCDAWFIIHHSIDFDSLRAMKSFQAFVEPRT